MDPLLEANANFALKLLRVLGEDSSKNVFFSPLGMSLSLSMISLGANGTTASQISQALSLYNCNSDGGGDVHQGFQSLLTEVNKSDRRHMLKTFNGVFVENSFEILASFKDACRMFYEAEIENMDFKGVPEQSRQHINTWVAKKTEDIIKELLSPGTVNSNTQLVLVNAFYFKGNWEMPFNKEDTREMPFKVSKNEKKIVQMMFKKSNFRTYYVEEISTTLILLPYIGNGLSITIMLPDDYVELRTVENQITHEKLTEWTKLEKMQEEEVEIFLPRFKLEENYNMKDVLCKLGMTDAFEEGRADFSGISSKPGLSLSKVVHKSVVEVNEEGTETAAPTEIVMMGSPSSPQCLVADHPFLFLIQDDRSKAILFLGRFSSPC